MRTHRKCLCDPCNKKGEHADEKETARYNSHLLEQSIPELLHLGLEAECPQLHQPARVLHLPVQVFKVLPRLESVGVEKDAISSLRDSGM